MSSSRRHRIGLLFDSFWDDFEATAWRGVVDEARSQKVDLLCFAGGSLKSPYSSHANRAVIHDLISRENVDGLLVISGCIGAFLERNELRDYLDRFSGIPLISVSTAFDDVSSTLVDNTSGMRDLVSHFIEQHDRKRIAFITGPETTFDARERLNAYMQALADHGIPFDPQLVVPGNFVHESGRRAAFTLVNERKVAFDAVVAANDNMALYAAIALQELGIKVPEQVLVGGFDDAKESRSASPSLTTVRQPTYELGRRSVVEMVQWPKTGVPVKSVVLPTRLVVRESCGCLGNHGGFAGTDTIGPRRGALEETLPILAQKLKQRFIIVSDVLGRDNWVEELIDTYVAEYRGDVGAFRRTVEAIITECGNRPIESSTWAEVLHYLFSLLDMRLQGTSVARDAALLFVNQYTSRRQAAHWVDYENQTQAMQRYQQPISDAFGMQQLGDIVAETLPRLGIHELWLSLYEHGRFDALGESYPLMTLKRESLDKHTLKVYPDSASPRFKTAALIPGGVGGADKARQLLVFPLFFEQEQFGMAVFEIGGTVANLYESLCSHLISLIKGMRLLQETRNYTAKLESDVAARTTELQSKNRQIEILNAELIEKNKVDVLTDLYNRGAFFELLKKELNRTRRNRQREQGKLDRRALGDHQTFSVMMCDLDHFKLINDTYGHLVGDQVLKTVGELLKTTSVIRQEDVAGRFGGEEFVIVLTNTDCKNAIYPAQRFADKLRKVVFDGGNGRNFNVTVSIGISQYHDDNGNEQAMIARADQALYYAKNNGRDRIVVYEDIPGVPELPA